MHLWVLPSASLALWVAGTFGFSFGFSGEEGEANSGCLMGVVP
jgi:hypothetical protein